MNKGANWGMRDFSLIEEVHISKVSVRNALHCCPERLNKTKVYIGNQLCGQIPDGIPLGSWAIVTCDLYGTEVKLVTVQNTWLILTGIEVRDNNDDIIE